MYKTTIEVETESVHNPAAAIGYGETESESLKVAIEFFNTWGALGNRMGLEKDAEILPENISLIRTVEVLEPEKEALNYD